jgi:hypothetical protein
VISFSVLSLSACSPWESGMHLIITVKEPQDGAIVTSSPVTISGTLSKHATVKINETQLSGKGSEFSIVVPLTEGINVINITAISSDPDETVDKKVTITYTPDK